MTSYCTGISIGVSSVDPTTCGWWAQPSKFAETGGVPVPGEIANGATINHPDVDLAEPEWNTSGVPWHTLYFRDNYPRLQRAKARWDPHNVFHHALSIRLAAPR